MNYLNFSKNLISESLLIFLGVIIISIFFSYSEKEGGVKVAGVASDSVEINVTVSEVISISSPANASMSPEIVGSGLANGSVNWNIITNNSSGWKLEVESNTDPAMQKGSDSFLNYTESVSGVPETWSVNNNSSEFGFSVNSDYEVSGYSGGSNFRGFPGISKVKIAEDSSVTVDGGADVSVLFKAEVGVDKTQPSGLYTATIKATATTL